MKDMQEMTEQEDIEELLSRIDAELNSGHPENALALIENNRSRMPNNIQIPQKEVLCQYAMGNKALAISMQRDLVERFPRNMSAALQLIYWNIEAGDTGSSSSLLDSWKERFPDSPFVRLCEIRLIRARGDITHAWELCNELIRLEPSREGAWIERLLMTEDGPLSHKWGEVAEQVAAAFPGSTRMLQAVKLSALRRGDTSLMSKIAQQISGGGMDSPKGCHLVARFQYDQREISYALKMIEEGLAKYPDYFPLLFLRLEASRANGQSDSVMIEYARSVIEHKAVESRAIQVAMRILLKAGKDELAWKLLQKIVLNNSLDSGVRKLAKNFLKTGIVKKKRDEVDPGISMFDGDVVMRLPGGVRHVVFIFIGLGPVRMATLDPVLECLNKAGLGSVVLYDRQRFLYLKGLSCFGDDYESTVNALRGLLPDSVQTVSCLGTSGGGYPAMRYAIDLKASSALVFGSPSNFVPGEYFRNDTRARNVGNRIVAAAPHMCVNLAHIYERASHRPKVQMWYGEGFQQDRDQALNMQGVPGVTLHAVPDYELHHVMAYLDTIGKLEDVVRQAFIDPA